MSGCAVAGSAVAIGGNLPVPPLRLQTPLYTHDATARGMHMSIAVLLTLTETLTP